MSFRKLKILSELQKREWNDVTVPEIKLEGKWFEKIGFEIGGEVMVKQQKGKLTITPKKVDKNNKYIILKLKSKRILQNVLFY